MRLPPIVLTLLAAGLVAGLPLRSRSHDIWIEAERGDPDVGQSLGIVVGGGHHYPASSLVVPDRLIAACEVRIPDRLPISLTTVAADGQREGLVTIITAAVHLVSLTLQRPPSPAPQAWARTILIPAGAADDNPAAYRLNQGLEIVPAAPIGAVSGSPLPLQILYEGEPQAGTLTVIPAGGRTTWLQARPESPALLHAQPGTRYLVQTQRGSQTATLTFTMPDP